jgi:hypothetical protein
MTMLPVTPWPLLGPGYWGSPFGRPHRVNVGQHPHGYRIPKGIYMVTTGPNKVELVYREDDDFSDEPRRQPGTGLVTRRAPRPRPKPPSASASSPYPKPPPCPKPPPPPGPGDNRWRRDQLVGNNTTGVVFADGWSVILSGAGEATTIRVF